MVSIKQTNEARRTQQVKKDYNTIYFQSLSNRILVVGGGVMFNILCFVMSIVFAHKMITDDIGYVFVVMLEIFCALGLDLCFAKIHIVACCLTKCKIDHIGLHCSILGIKKWDILWEDIRIYGIRGFNSPYMVQMFFYCDPSEKHDPIKNFVVNNQRIVFEYERKRWDLVAQYAPEDIKEKIEYSLWENNDCFHRRTGK